MDSRSWTQHWRDSTAPPGLFNYALNATRCISTIVSKRINRLLTEVCGGGGARRSCRKAGNIGNVQEFILKFPFFKWCWSWSFKNPPRLFRFYLKRLFTGFILTGLQFSCRLVSWQLGMRTRSGINTPPTPPPESGVISCPHTRRP